MTAPTAEDARRTAWSWAALAAVGVASDVVLDPEHRHVPLCPFKAVTGLQCPLCGSLRSVDAAIHGHWQHAWHDNALLWLLLPVAAVYFASAATGRPVSVSRRTVQLIALFAALFTLLRNAFPALHLLPT